LWMEPEQVVGKSKVLAEHPDWVLKTAAGRTLGSGHTQPLDLANPEAARFVEESVLRAVRDFKVDILKIDYNVRVYQGGQSLRAGYLEQESWRHCEVMYRLFDRINREFPNVVLETCAGGGGRSDLGMLSRFHYGCESDLSWFPLSIRAINGLGIFLPPECICYYHNHVMYAHQTADLDTHLRVTLFTNTVFVGFGDQDSDRSTAHYQAVKRYIELATSFCYPIMAGPAIVYHHTPNIGVSTPARWCVLEYAAPDRTRAYAGIFALSAERSSENHYLFRPRGLDQAREYDVTLDNEQQVVRMTGRQLAHEGLLVHLDSALTSQLLLFEARE
jgi:alpha-galactosidase